MKLIHQTHYHKIPILTDGLWAIFLKLCRTQITKKYCKVLFFVGGFVNILYSEKIIIDRSDTVIVTVNYNMWGLHRDCLQYITGGVIL